MIYPCYMKKNLCHLLDYFVEFMLVSKDIIYETENIDPEISLRASLLQFTSRQSLELYITARQVEHIEIGCRTQGQQHFQAFLFHFDGQKKNNK